MLSAYETGKTLPTLTSLATLLAAIGKISLIFKKSLICCATCPPSERRMRGTWNGEGGRVVLRAIQDVIERQAERGTPRSSS